RRADGRFDRVLARGTLIQRRIPWHGLPAHGCGTPQFDRYSDQTAIFFSSGVPAERRGVPRPRAGSPCHDVASVPNFSIVIRRDEAQNRAITSGATMANDDLSRREVLTGVTIAGAAAVLPGCTHAPPGDRDVSPPTAENDPPESSPPVGTIP